MRRVLLLIMALVLGGCVRAVQPATLGCKYKMYPIETAEPIPEGALPPGQRVGMTAGGQELADRVRAAIDARPQKAPSERTRPPGEVLVLSGGSQWGAFGAGFFAGLPAVPDYDVVTAVSTGALQSTLLFLANQPIPGDRKRPPYMANGGIPRSNVEELARAYSIGKESDLLDVGGFGLLGGIARGSVATFEPLRETLKLLLSPETINQVGRAARDKRLLLIGVTNISDGHGYALDLTQLARRALDDPASMPLVQTCYVDAIVASASVPLAVPPVSLERAGSASAPEIYIDGGARFGVFWTQLEDIVAAAGDVNVSIVVNQDLAAQPWLDKAGKPVRRWSAITLAERAEKMLENQVYRFSVDAIAAKAQRLRYATLTNRGTRQTDTDSGDFVWVGRTCGEWMKRDKRELHPAEFHPRYMRCLLEYARKRGVAADWNADLDRQGRPAPH